MIRKTIRRGGLLVATTALAGAAFAGSAAASTSDHYDPFGHNGLRDSLSLSVAGVGGPGGVSGVSQDNCTANYQSPVTNAPIVTGATGTTQFDQDFNALQCNVGSTGDASGGGGIDIDD